MNRRIAFISYETPYAPNGGLAAVLNRLPQAVAQASGLPTAIVTPYHYQIEKTTRLNPRLTLLGQFHIHYDQAPVMVTVLALEPERQWIFLKAEDPRFFAGKRHPYDVDDSGGEHRSILLRDALLFGLAAVKSLEMIDPDASWTLILQEWEAATVALALTGMQSRQVRQAFITLHNSYDSGLPNAELARYRIDPRLCPGETVLQRALPLVQKPIFTVSGQFARDLTTEILQTEVMVPHLQSFFVNRLYGVDNGVFTECAVDPAALSAGGLGDFTRLRSWKNANRAQAASALKALPSSPEKPVWGDLEHFLSSEEPWIIMGGRDDSRQKGYDVAAAATARFLAEGGQAQFLFFPIPGDEGLQGLGFLRRLPQEFPAYVLVLPFIFQEGYFAALQGAAFGLIPSFYEPFGMANEFYLKGTPAIGRATGGLLEQIISYPGVQSFSPAVCKRAELIHPAYAHPTGFLYREPDNLPSQSAGWHAINDAGYAKSGGRPDRIEERMQLPLFQTMVSELHQAIQDALSVYSQQPDRYYRMIVDGIDTIQSRFTWERAAREYSACIHPRPGF